MREEILKLKAQAFDIIKTIEEHTVKINSLREYLQSLNSKIEQLEGEEEDGGIKSSEGI
jgi:uncharacterized coiled-coil DUF342 family protein